MRSFSATSLAAITVALAVPAAAQDAPPASDAAESDPDAEADEDVPISDNEILVIAEALRGTVDTDQPPLLELGEADIAAYGASSIADLIAALGDTASNGRGQGGGFPVILVNGMRITSFRELRSYPPEAIQKVEVFPEEVAQQYGYSADQRVVNLVLKDNYSSREIELEYGQPFDGGTSTKEVEATLVRIAGQSRLNFNAQYQDRSTLTEAERDIVQSGGGAGDSDQAPYRSLVADSDEIKLDGNWTTSLGTGTSLTLNSSFERSNTLSLQGLDTVSLDQLAVDNRRTTYAAGAGLNTSLGDWQLSVTADGNRATSKSVIDRRADSAAPTVDPGEDEAKSTTDSLSGKSTLIGRPFYLPAGDVSVTFDAGYDWTRIERDDTRTTGGPTSLKRGVLNAGVNMALPLTSVADDVLAGIGDTTLQLSAGVDRYSDFGTLYDWSAGLIWAPLEWITLNASYIGRDRAPSLAQLGNPEIATPNVQVFDLSRNETVLATVVTGGNPNLPAESQSNFKIGANIALPFIDDARLSIDYYDDHSTDVAASFPTLTPTIEAAFPGRVTRDASGRLIQLDQRPVTFAAQASRRIQVGLNLGGAFGKPRESARQNANPMRAVFTAARGGGQGGNASGQGGGQGAQGDGQGRGGFGGGRFNPEFFQQMRERLCTDGGEVTPEMLAEAPDFLKQRMLNEDGTINAEAAAQMKQRMCSPDTAGGPGGSGGPGGGQRPNFDPAVMAAFRTKLCSGETITVVDLADLPEGLRTVLLGPDGTVSDNRVEQIRSRICRQPDDGAAAAGEGGGSRRDGGDARPRGGGNVIIAGSPPGGGGPPGGGVRGPGGGGFRGPSGDGRGRWFANLSYTYALQEEVLIAEGGPLLDLLDGDALGGSGRTRHGASLTGGFFYAGFGARYSVRYTGKSTLDGSRLPGSTDLTFHDLATVDLRLFADLNERTRLLEAVPFLKNTRVSLAFDNLFDARQRVTDNSGTVPLRYQPYLIDPLGRQFSIEFRKLF